MGSGGLLMLVGVNMVVVSRAASLHPRQTHTHTYRCPRVCHAGTQPTRPQDSACSLGPGGY